jgi:nucleotide-binding universal stress UspA family protein
MIGKIMSYRIIIAVINEHTASTVSAHYAMALAASCGSHLVLYCVHDNVHDSATSSRTERHLNHLFSEARAVGVAVSRIAESGAITRLLPHRSHAEVADLVFYPLTPGEQYGATLQQQTAHHLLRTIKADLAVMRIMHMGKPHPRHMLVPVGGLIRDREQRVRFLAALAKAFHAQVTLFHRPETGRQDLPADVVALRNDLRSLHLPLLERGGSGQIARAIALEAVSHHNDLIVLGASERGTVRRLFFGNPAGDVMHQPPCNAILFRPALRLP